MNIYHQGPACTYLQVKDSFAGKGSWWKLESLTFWHNNNVCSGLHNWANGGGDHQKQKVSFLPHIFCNFYIFLQLLILFFTTFDLVFLFILWYLLSGFNLSWFAHPEHKLLLCHMGKHGSTTWARCPRLNILDTCVFQLLFLHVHRARARASRSVDANSSKEVKHKKLRRFQYLH